MMYQPLNIETCTIEVLESLIEELKNEQQYIEDRIGKLETELFYRNNPECRPQTNQQKDHERTN